MIRKIPKTVGCIVIYDDDDNPWSSKWAVEQGYGRNIRGEEGLFYWNASAASYSVSTDNRIYYMPTVPNGYIESTDPDFYKYIFTYEQLLKICKGNRDLLQDMINLFAGQDPLDLYKEIMPKQQNNWRRNRGKRRK